MGGGVVGIERVPVEDPHEPTSGKAEETTLYQREHRDSNGYG